MKILFQDRVVGELVYPGRSGKSLQFSPNFGFEVRDPGPELREIISKTHTVCTGGSCLLGGGSRWERVRFRDMGLCDQVRELRCAGFAIRSDSGEVLEPLMVPKIVLQLDPPLKSWSW